MEAAYGAGALAVALSGAGPSLIAFSKDHDPAIGLEITKVFNSKGLSTRVFDLDVSQQGAQVINETTS